MSVLIVLGVLPAADTVSPMGRLLLAAVFFGPCAVVFAGWGRLLRRRVVRSAALDGARLRARTIDGREHDLAPSDVIEVHSTFSPPWSLLTAVRHPGGTLWISRPAGDELVQRLVTAAHPTRRSRWGV